MGAIAERAGRRQYLLLSLVGNLGLLIFFKYATFAVHSVAADGAVVVSADLDSVQRLIVDAAGNVSVGSPALTVTIDTSIPSAPDLVASSDSGFSRKSR